MRFGNLVSYDAATFADDLKLHRDLGFDYAEVLAHEFLGPKVASSQWDAAAPDPESLALPIETACCLLTADMRVVGPQRKFTLLQDTMQRVAKRAERYGISRVVFGSGDARRRPDEVLPEVANDQIEEFARMAGEVFAHHGLTLCIEHINSRDSNTITRLTEARELCDRIALPSVGLCVNSYHYGIERESDRTVVTLGDRVKHVQVAEPIGRAEPGVYAASETNADAEKPFDFEAFFCWLHKIGYNERITIEADWTGPVAERGSASLAHLKKTWSASGICES